MTDEPSTDWRVLKGYYLTICPCACAVCGSQSFIGIEPRFGYAVCEEHSGLSPVEVSDRQRQRRVGNDNAL